MITLDISAGVNVPAGLGRYTRSLTQALLPYCTPQVFYNQIRGRSQPIFEHLPTYKIRMGYKPWRMAVWLGQMGRVPFNSLIPHTQVYHATEHLLMPLEGIKTVMTVHDLIFKLFPEHHKRLNYWFLNAAMPLFVRRADHLIAISQATKTDLVTHYQTPAEKISVIYEAADPHFVPQTPAQIAEVRQRYTLPEKFVLVVGTIEPRKNYLRLLEALHNLRDKDLYLVVVGNKGWLYEPFFARLEELGAEKWVHFTGYIPDEDLPAIYAAARIFAMPSLYEGFGLPILEAMSVGTPVVSSSAASLPELGGEAVHYFDPHNRAEMEAVIAEVWRDDQMQAEMRAAGLAQAAKFTWDASARQTLAIYQQLGARIN